MSIVHYSMGLYSWKVFEQLSTSIDMNFTFAPNLIYTYFYASCALLVDFELFDDFHNFSQLGLNLLCTPSMALKFRVFNFCSLMSQKGKGNLYSKNIHYATPKGFIFRLRP